ncbi:hypothetical protein GPJ56_000686 [Histomonas meleagridis]|uniref:uncharacterized protein n=1 Tax=Histomonas meleagridis TaxID=135588 RepID=UPI00355AA1B3|nr:hypothetical protein GPJ56_000686 [Histomonas meleagridis]KAH0804815.1 hypothetical protein GO595_002509 [Histomonas meleagridis]
METNPPSQDEERFQRGMKLMEENLPGESMQYSKIQGRLDSLLLRPISIISDIATEKSDPNAWNAHINSIDFKPLRELAELIANRKRSGENSKHIQNLTKENEILKEKIDLYEKENQRLQKKLSKLQDKETSQEMEAVTLLNNKLAELSEEINSQQKKVQDQNDEMNNLKQEIDSIKSKAAEEESPEIVERDITLDLSDDAENTVPLTDYQEVVKERDAITEKCNIFKSIVCEIHKIVFGVKEPTDSDLQSMEKSKEANQLIQKWKEAYEHPKQSTEKKGEDYDQAKKRFWIVIAVAILLIALLLRRKS